MGPLVPKPSGNSSFERLHHVSRRMPSPQFGTQSDVAPQARWSTPLRSCDIGETDAKFLLAPEVNRLTSQMRQHAMIKVSVMYPNTPGARFDHAYYRDKHMPLVKARMGDACKSYTVDKGVAGGAPGAPATYVGMCHIFCDSIEAFQAGFGPHANEIMGDIPNYTDQSPVIQISEVVVG
jgi:uncharacterized protein (TIGR02118 family)